jgi:hypothetical protein
MRTVSMDIHGHMSMDIHVLLRSDQRTLLLGESARSGLSMAELIRRAIDLTYEPDKRPTVFGFELNLGVWRRLDAAVTGKRLRRID